MEGLDIPVAMRDNNCRVHVNVGTDLGDECNRRASKERKYNGTDDDDD